jgi:hypothetical protein
MLLGSAVLALAGAAEATPTCNAPARLIQYPAQNPVWEFCMLTPLNSSGPNGAGLEIFDAFYNGHQVFKRAHAPILNVLYAPGGCGCFRDWSDSEVRFEAITASGPASSSGGGYVDVVQPPRTVCEVGGSAGDLGSFSGVAAERLADQLVLTTQFQAGWYRYTMRWMFHQNGSFSGWFGFAAVPAGCVSSDHTHHNYWRIDFDVDGAGSDSIERVPGGQPPQGIPQTRPGRQFNGMEATYVAGPPDWRVRDTVTGRGFNLRPGPSIAVDSFSVSDYWFLNYSPNEIDDAGQPGPSCAIKISNFINSQPVSNTDVVFWIRGGQFHEGGDLDDCHTTWFSFEPIGNWQP